MASSIVELEVSGRRVEAMVRPLTTLQAVLRQLGFTSVKEGCRQGGCGSCTVLLDGEPVFSCLVPVEDAVGRRITTLEGIAPDDRQGLSVVQRAFLEANGFQCGYCTPGMVVLATALLDHEPAPRRERIVEALAGNVCRCTGYLPIVDAIEAAARQRQRRAAVVPATGTAASAIGSEPAAATTATESGTGGLTTEAASATEVAR